MSSRAKRGNGIDPTQGGRVMSNVRGLPRRHKLDISGANVLADSVHSVKGSPRRPSRLSLSQKRYPASKKPQHRTCDPIVPHDPQKASINESRRVEDSPEENSCAWSDHDAKQSPNTRTAVHSNTVPNSTLVPTNTIDKGRRRAVGGCHPHAEVVHAPEVEVQRGSC